MGFIEGDSFGSRLFLGYPASAEDIRLAELGIWTEIVSSLIDLGRSLGA